MLKGFRDFILRGNVMDLAVAFIMGAAFTTVVNSFTNDVVMKFIAAFVGKTDFKEIVLTVNGTQILVGNFITAVVQFLLVAFVVYFFMVLPLNSLMARFKGPLPETAPTTKTCPECKSEIPVTAKRCAHCIQVVA